jgi:hypothetical protein
VRRCPPGEIDGVSAGRDDAKTSDILEGEIYMAYERLK